MSAQQVKIVVIAVIAIMAALLTYTIVVLTSEGTHDYVTGSSVYEVQEIRTGQTVYYKIKIYINNNPTPSYIFTRYEPGQLEKLDIENVKSKILDKKEFFITINPYANLTGLTTIAALEIDKFLDNRYLFNIPVSSAFTEDYNNGTVKTCSDADEDTGIFLLRLGNMTRLFSREECIVLEGKTEEDLIMLADRLVFQLLGMMG